MTHIDNIQKQNQDKIYHIIKDLEMIISEKKDLEDAEQELKE